MSLGIPPPDALKERVRAAVAETSSSRLGWPARVAIAVVTIAAAMAIALTRMRPDLHAPSGALLGLTGALAALAIAISTVGFATGRSGLGASLATLALGALATAPLYATFVTMWPLPKDHALPSVTGCFTMATVVGAVVLGGLTIALHRAVPSARVARGALIGACAGAWAGLAIHVHCPALETEHLLVGHALPIVIAIGLGAAIVPRFLRP